MGAAPTTLPMDTLTGLMSQFQNLVFDNEEMLQLVVDGPNDVVVVTQYEISVLEITPV